MSTGIEQVTDVFDLCANVVDDLVKAKADGSISMSEALAIVGSNAAGIMAAFTGMEQIDDELRDLDPQESKQLAIKGIELAKKVLELVKPS